MQLKSSTPGRTPRIVPKPKRRRAASTQSQERNDPLMKNTISFRLLVWKHPAPWKQRKIAQSLEVGQVLMTYGGILDGSEVGTTPRPAKERVPSNSWHVLGVFSVPLHHVPPSSPWFFNSVKKSYFVCVKVGSSLRGETPESKLHPKSFWTRLPVFLSCNAVHRD